MNLHDNSSNNSSYNNSCNRRSPAAALALLLALVLALAALWTGPARASYPPNGAAGEAPVGEVSLVLGEAWLESAREGRRRIANGTEIRASDRVRTAANGHVHIRFVDQALVSVRPDSHLEITRYDYDAEHPERSTIKFTLEEGVTRSISGKAARSAKERYRMNTPIAAIGVRGTDFVVSADPGTVRAQVNEGAIVVAPFSPSCLVNALGPCSLNGTELTSASGHVLELGEGQDMPQLLPVPDTRIPELMRERRDENQRQRQEMAANNEAVDEADSPEDRPEGTGENSDLYRESVSYRNAEEVAATSAEPDNPGQPEMPAGPDFTPASQIASSELEQRQLVWGRWGTGRGDAERISTTYGAASQDPRKVAVTGNGYMLYRAENGDQHLQPDLGAVSFDLDMAQAFLHPLGGAPSAMRVDGGRLDIDFNRGEFATALRLDHERTGMVDFSAAGAVDARGYFHTRDDLQSIGGAVSLDGEEAGYFFQKRLGEDKVEGLTLWGRQ